MKKGVSPLIAVIMLIAVTMIVAGIVVTWAEQFASRQRTNIELCSEARAVVQGGSYNAGTLNLIVQNTGKVDLTFSVFFTYKNDSVSKYPNDLSLTAQNIDTFSFNEIGDNLQEVTVQSNECPGVQDLLQYFYIKGL
ncbi:MAG: hypothetical protein KKA62_05920 [Nanoarchaeota archaeon]|nr:hypothetical protein [Nanoarchaeota archaeon]